MRILRPPVRLLRQADLIFAERLAVRGVGILLVRSAVSDVTVNHHQCRAIVRAQELIESIRERIEIIRVSDMGHVPAICAEPHRDVFTERPICRAIKRDLVRVVDPTKVRQLKVSGKGCGLAADSFHEIAITAERIHVVVENFEPRTVVTRLQPLGRDGHSHTVANTLAQRARGGFNARSVAILRVARSLAIELAKTLKIVERNGWTIKDLIFGVNGFYAREIEHRVQQH